MKVMCIKDCNGFKLTASGDRLPLHPSERVYVGSVYTVILLVPGFTCDVAYKLAERSFKTRFKAEYFIPLSDIDETEMIREEVKINQLN